MIFEVVYRVEGYSLADAMRPNPFWGKRIFRVDSEKVQCEDIEAFREAAIATAPERYRFFSIQALPGGAKLFAQPTAPITSGEALDDQAIFDLAAAVAQSAEIGREG